MSFHRVSVLRLGASVRIHRVSMFEHSLRDVVATIASPLLSIDRTAIHRRQRERPTLARASGVRPTASSPRRSADATPYRAPVATETAIASPSEAPPTRCRSHTVWTFRRWIWTRQYKTSKYPAFRACSNRSSTPKTRPEKSPSR